MKSGVYKITNLETGKTYIGSAQLLEKRWRVHKSKLKSNHHDNKYLQSSWNKYGEDYFIFEILEYCPEDELVQKEQVYIDQLKPEYNLRRTASSNLGLKWSTEKTKALGIQRRGKKRPDISQNMIGNTYGSNASFSKERREKLSQSMRERLSKPVVAMDETGSILSEHPSVRNAGLFYEVSPVNISYSCKNSTMIRKIRIYFKYKNSEDDFNKPI